MPVLDARWRFALKFLTLAAGTALVILLFMLTREVFLNLPATSTPATTSGERQFELIIERPAAQNGQGRVSWRLRPTPGNQLNPEYPTRLELTPGPGLSLTKARYLATDFAPHGKKEMRVAVPYAVNGLSRLDYVLRFGVCELQNGQVKVCSIQHQSGVLPLGGP